MSLSYQNQCFYNHRPPTKQSETLFDSINRRFERRRHNDVCKLAKNHLPFLHGLKLMNTLSVHDGCVNTICWNNNSQYILSGSDDSNLCITKPAAALDKDGGYTVMNKVQTRHLGNIFSARFLPETNDSVIASCSSHGPVLVHDVNNLETPAQSIYNFNCHSSIIFRVVTVPDEPKTFLTCGQDKTVRLFDLRCHRSCHRASTCPHPSLIKSSQPVSTISVHPHNSNLILIGRTDGVGLLYDRRKLPDVRAFSRERAHEEYLANQENGIPPRKFTYIHPMEGVISTFKVPDIDNTCQLSTLVYSSGGDQILASYSNDYVYLFNQDKSSKFQLIQTMTGDNSTGQGEAYDERSPRRHSKTHDFPRIRVRGDWSDTGINSSPYSTMTNEFSSQRSRTIFARMTEVALANHARGNFTVNLGQSSDNASGATQDVPATTSGPGDAHKPATSNANVEMDGVTTSDITIQNTVSGKQQESPVKHPNLKPKTRMNFEAALAKLKDRYSSIPTYHPRVCYKGHRNSRTIIKDAVFWGDKYVMSGSDCGRIMIWEKDSAKLIMCVPADRRVVNCLAPSPDLYALASSGLDNDIKIWSTQREENPFLTSELELNEIVKTNEIMLNEARQTVIVPPHFIFRVLESLSRSN